MDYGALSVVITNFLFLDEFLEEIQKLCIEITHFKVEIVVRRFFLLKRISLVANMLCIRKYVYSFVLCELN